MANLVKLSIERPRDFDVAAWPAANDKLMRLLIDRFDIQPDDGSVCNWLLFDFLTTSQCKDIAVLVFGNDMPYTINMVKQLRLIGDGACPKCGSNSRDDITGGFTRNDDGALCVNVLGWHCNNCSFEEYR
jgi:hypothetical protein